ncbi:MAG: hypothetical protein CSA53_05320 [Gammaproteobacteria bacterium]|nr:MAG: hypothetical protein CSA53_05320 [Gammaproteobacteria bacterium]
MSTPCASAFDQWIRNDFKTINSELEALYFATGNPSEAGGVGEALKQQLLLEGKAFIAQLLREGNTDEGFDSGFNLLGNVGFYMAACRRHDLTEPSREKRSPLEEASALAMQLGVSLGVIPRFASAHLETHNKAENGVYKTFTDKAHGHTATQHHELLISRFIESPAAKDEMTMKADLTASGPPLPDLLRGLKKLCDLRNAAPVDNINTRFADFQTLRTTLKG